MDIQSQVAARRAELEAQQKKEIAEQKAAKKAQREAALDGVATELATLGVDVRRDGDELALHRTLPPIDAKSLKKDELELLLKREARKLWTPGQNWQVIASITAGIALLPFSMWWLVLSLLGFALRAAHNHTHRQALREAHPNLFGPSELPTP